MRGTILAQRTFFPHGDANVAGFRSSFCHGEKPLEDPLRRETAGSGFKGEGTSLYIRQACKSCDLQMSTDKASSTAIFKSLSGSRCKRRARACLERCHSCHGSFNASTSDLDVSKDWQPPLKERNVGQHVAETDNGIDGTGLAHQRFCACVPHHRPY